MITLSIGQIIFGSLCLVAYTILVAHTMLTLDDHLTSWDFTPETRLEKFLRVSGMVASIPGILVAIIVAMIIATPFELYYRFVKK